MAFFGVTCETIDTISPIPNADALEVATLTGMEFPFVIRKGEWNVGDPAIYFPVDSLIPVSVQEKLGLVGRLSGSNKDRVKTIRLRGQVSMGVVAKPSLFIIPPDVEDLTTFFGVSKYDPESVPCQSGILLPLPCGLSKYDIEGADRYSDIFHSLLDESVVVMEKLEGQNVSFTLNVATGQFYVNQRSYTIIPVEGKTHHIWKWAIDHKVEENMKKMIGFPVTPNSVITLYGELIGPGIQGNHYKLGTYDVKFFDVKVDDRFLNYNTCSSVIDILGLEMVPVIVYSRMKTLREVLDGKTTQQFATGPSTINPAVLREGVVYKPHTERYTPKIGRLILKTRDPVYLEKTGN